MSSSSNNTNTNSNSNSNNNTTATKIDYNYERFEPDRYDLESFTGLKIGEKYQDVTLYTLDGEPTRLSQYLSEDNKPLVLELGSMTCPLYANNTSKMQKVVNTYKNKFNFVVMYVREAHPGNYTKPHSSLFDKVKAARVSKKFHNEDRPILVDDVYGTAHKIYGSLPNTIYIIQNNKIKFVGTWNVANELEPILCEIATSANASNEDDKDESGSSIMITTDTTTMTGTSVELEKKFVPIPQFNMVFVYTLFQGGIVAVYDFLSSLKGLMNKKHAVMSKK